MILEDMVWSIVRVCWPYKLLLLVCPPCLMLLLLLGGGLEKEEDVFPFDVAKLLSRCAEVKLLACFRVVVG